MIVETQKVTTHVVGNNDIQSGQFGIDVNNFAHITKLLSKSLYSNPVRTLMIEYVQNAIDTHFNAKTDKKVKVIIPTSNHLFYEVQDFGEGMSPEFVLNKLTQYGTTTKNKSNDVAGGFGIGFKASAIYCDNFTMIVNYNGIKYTYDVTNHEGSGSITMLEKEPTTEHNGTTIKIPVEPADIDKFNSLINQLYSRLKEKIEVYVGTDNKAYKFDSNIVYNKLDSIEYSLNKNTNSEINLYVKNIHIECVNTHQEWDNISTFFRERGKCLLSTEQYKLIERYWKSITRIMEYGLLNYHRVIIHLDIPIEKFELTISRESFIRTDQFYAYLLAQFATIIDDIVNKTIDKCNAVTDNDKLEDICNIIADCPVFCTYVSEKLKQTKAVSVITSLIKTVRTGEEIVAFSVDKLQEWGIAYLLQHYYMFGDSVFTSTINWCAVCSSTTMDNENLLDRYISHNNCLESNLFIFDDSTTTCSKQFGALSAKIKKLVRSNTEGTTTIVRARKGCNIAERCEQFKLLFPHKQVIYVEKKAIAAKPVTPASQYDVIGDSNYIRISGKQLHGYGGRFEYGTTYVKLSNKKLLSNISCGHSCKYILLPDTVKYTVQDVYTYCCEQIKQFIGIDVDANSIGTSRLFGFLRAIAQCDVLIFLPNDYATYSNINTSSISEIFANVNTEWVQQYAATVYILSNVYGNIRDCIKDEYHDSALKTVIKNAVNKYIPIEYVASYKHIPNIITLNDIIKLGKLDSKQVHLLKMISLLRIDYNSNIDMYEQAIDAFAASIWK